MKKEKTFGKNLYTVIRIDEDLDFGCEDRSDENPVMAVVTLEDLWGEESVIRVPDALLYQKGIDEGSEVYYQENPDQKTQNQDVPELDTVQAIVQTIVHKLYYNYDLNCARTTLSCLEKLFGIKIEPQLWAAAAGMHGAGGYRAQCGLVEGALLFLGVYGSMLGGTDLEIADLCFWFADAFSIEFGGLTCRELRPWGFNEDDEPHMCEGITDEAILFAYRYVRKHLGTMGSV